MNVGQEIVKEQLFFRRELRERVYWFIKLRWAAVCLGLIGLATAFFLNLKVPLGSLAAVIFFVLFCNVLFLFIGRRLEGYAPTDVGPFQVFAHIQISLDLFSLYLIVFLTGGLASPLLIFFIFHVVIAAILLSSASCYTYAFIISLALAGTIGLHLLDLVPVPTDRFGAGGAYFQQQASHYLALYITFAAGLLIVAYLATSIKAALEYKGRQLMRISRQFDLTNTKLKSLYNMIKEIGTYATSRTLMDAATRQAASLMGVKACSIKLLDQEHGCLRFASTYGLSEDYLSKDCISLAESAINRRIVEGHLYSIGSVEESEAFQYPEDMRKEGLASMLCLPLKVENKILGVFCVYSNERNFFKEEDADFFSLMTDLIALAMERLNRDLAKTWFMNKAAHQLRSPLNTLQSMLKVIDGGYLGALNDQQKETIGRCTKRLSILQDTINDLLKLATERQQRDQNPRFVPVDVAESLLALQPLYRTQAEQKGVNIDFLVPDDLPPVLAQEKLIDELFSNLISNAIKYTPAGGRISVGLSEFSPELVMFEVRDTGIGIPESELPRLFTEFFRAENAKNMAEEGTGLGLVIAKEIINLVGGSIRVDSKVRQGTRFTCLLPASPVQKNNLETSVAA